LIVKGSEIPNASVQMPKNLQGANLIITSRHFENAAEGRFLGVWGFVICDFSRDENLTCLP
jgi:hypothetical protein